MASCGGPRYLLTSAFDEHATPPSPDYSNQGSWAALPDKSDPSDSVPGNHFKNNQDSAVADVFFIHPTTFTYKPQNNYRWNADVNDEDLNRKTDNTTILYQASIFNGSCRVYAPRYRQAHLSTFFTSDKVNGKRALEIAYADVKNSFQYYLDHYNHGRPFILASHSQGTVHAYRLIKDVLTDSLLKEKLVTAYLVGMPINADSLSQILEPCTAPDQTNCYCTWNTFEQGYYPSYYDKGLKNAVCTNPLSWKCDTGYCPPVLNEGAVLLNFNDVMPELFDAQVHDGMLWLNKPKFPGAFLIQTKIYHRGDYNLFYVNIRENAEERVKSYFKQRDLHTQQKQ
jgi:hypothetical protein